MVVVTLLSDTIQSGGILMRRDFELDPDVSALYVRFRDGTVARTLSIGQDVFLDVNEQGEPLGIELVNADDFRPLLHHIGGGTAMDAALGEAAVEQLRRYAARFIAEVGR
jgi:uncharacterized protein YuzE